MKNRIIYFTKTYNLCKENASDLVSIAVSESLDTVSQKQLVKTEMMELKKKKKSYLAKMGLNEPGK